LGHNSVAGGIVDNISIELAHKVFSPNGDGDKDLAVVNYNLDKPDYFASINLYNDRGQQLSRLYASVPAATSGEWVWDGTIDGARAPIGIYILEINLFSLDGSTYQAKETVGLGEFLK